MGVGVGTGLDLIESENNPTIIGFEKPAKIVEMKCGESTMIMRDVEGKVYRTGLKLNYTPAALVIPSEYSFGPVQRVFCGRKHYTMLDGKQGEGSCRRQK